jgi:hypothetical protein
MFSAYWSDERRRQMRMADVLALSLVLISAAQAGPQGNGNPLAADRWSGTYQSAELRLDLSRQGGQYVGTITFNGDTLPVSATVQNNALEGAFSIGEHKFTFHAERVGDVVTLVSDGAKYVLQRQGTAAAAPSAGAAPAGESGIVGDWRWSQGLFHIGADGTAKIGALTYQYVLRNNVLVLTGADGKFEFPYELHGDSLTLTINGKATTLSRAGTQVHESQAPASPTSTSSSTSTSSPTGRGSGLIGEWHSPKLVIRIDAGGAAVIGGTPCRYVVRNNVIVFTGTDGNFEIPFELNGDSLMLTISGQPTQFTRGTQQQSQARGGGILPELVGKWCYMSNVNANNGGSASSTCVTLNANGTYQYHAESSSYNPNGSVAGQTDDTGTWTATDFTLNVISRARGPLTYRLEKRNHPKFHDPMLVIDGAAFVTFNQRAPW